MRLYVADGLKMAIDSSWGVAGCQVAVVDVDYTHQLLFGHNGATILSNFMTAEKQEGQIET